MVGSEGRRESRGAVERAGHDERDGSRGGEKARQQMGIQGGDSMGGEVPGEERVGSIKTRTSFPASGWELARRLVVSPADDSRDKLFLFLTKFNLLIIDEFGGLSYERQQITWLFRLISSRYERLLRLVPTPPHKGS